MSSLDYDKLNEDFEKHLNSIPEEELEEWLKEQEADSQIAIMKQYEGYE